MEQIVATKAILPNRYCRYDDPMKKTISLLVFALTGAVLVAASLVWFAHDLMGVPQGVLRNDAVFGAVLIGVVCAVSELKRK